MPFKDKKKTQEKNVEYQRKWYKNNKKKHKDRVNSRKRKIRNLLHKYKELHPCEVCGESCIVCLDFHHLLNADKKFCIGNAISLGYGWERILKELKKCKSLCRNCHAKLHWS